MNARAASNGATSAEGIRDAMRMASAEKQVRYCSFFAFEMQVFRDFGFFYKAKREKAWSEKVRFTFDPRIETKMRKSSILKAKNLHNRIRCEKQQSPAARIWTASQFGTTGLENDADAAR